MESTRGGTSDHVAGWVHTWEAGVHSLLVFIREASRLRRCANHSRYTASSSICPAATSGWCRAAAHLSALRRHAHYGEQLEQLPTLIGVGDGRISWERVQSSEAIAHV